MNKHKLRITYFYKEGILLNGQCPLFCVNEETGFGYNSYIRILFSNMENKRAIKNKVRFDFQSGNAK